MLNLDAHARVHLHLIETHGIRVDGQPATVSTSELRTQGNGGKQQPTRVSFGSSYLYVVENGINIVLALALYPSMHIRGLAYAYAAAYTVTAVIAYMVVLRTGHARHPDRDRQRV